MLSAFTITCDIILNNAEKKAVLGMDTYWDVKVGIPNVKDH